MDKWNEIVALAHSNWLHFLGTHYVGEGRLIHMQCRRRRCSQSQLLFALFDGICSHLLMLFYEDQCWWYCHLSDLPVLKSADALTVLPQGCIYFVYTYTTSCWNYCSLLNLWLKNTHPAEICLDGDQWNDGLLATIRERVWFLNLLVQLVLLCFFFPFSNGTIWHCALLIVSESFYDWFSQY